jgi:hypothetical protein
MSTADDTLSDDEVRRIMKRQGYWHCVAVHREVPGNHRQITRAVELTAWRILAENPTPLAIHMPDLDIYLSLSVILCPHWEQIGLAIEGMTAAEYQAIDAEPVTLDALGHQRTPV